MKHYTETQQKIFDLITPMTIPSGVGTKDNACTIAALNLSLSGELTDKIPDCCSEVIGKWAILIQDAMPAAMRNSERYKMLVPYLAGTSREPKKEAARLKTILDWMWNTVLPSLQTIADKNNFGRAWQNMLTLKTADASDDASNAAVAAAAANAAAKASNAAAANAAAAAANAASNASNAAVAAAAAAAYDASNDSNAAVAAAADAAAYAAAYDSNAAAYAAADAAADAAAYGAASAADACYTASYAAYVSNTSSDIWETFDPISLLEKLILVGEPVRKK